MKDYLMLALIAIVVSAVIGLALVKKSAELEKVPVSLRKKKKSNPNFRGRDNRDLYGG